MGYLYGQYEEYNGVPLGIKATVLAIYEPPQISNKDSVELLEDSRGSAMESLAGWLGIRRVGWIFTDLEASLESGKVRYKRNMHTFFLSAEECIMAANFQNKHPNLCKLGSLGKFGSKFVTVCVSGNQDDEIEMRGYQVIIFVFIRILNRFIVGQRNTIKYREWRLVVTSHRYMYL